MRTWAHWTAEAVMLTATFAAAGAGFTDTAFPVSGGSGARLVPRPGHRGPDDGGRCAQDGGTARPGQEAVGPPGADLADTGTAGPNERT
jgi:hypothetical protein